MRIARPYIELFTNFVLKYYQTIHEEGKTECKTTNLSEPHLWFPNARAMSPRKIHYHMGPTNSGKTKAAIDDMMKSKSGIYCAPLRLLAWVV